MSSLILESILEVWLHQRQNEMWNLGKQTFLQCYKEFRRIWSVRYSNSVLPEDAFLSVEMLVENDWFYPVISQKRFRCWVGLGSICFTLCHCPCSAIFSHKTFFEVSKFSEAKGIIFIIITFIITLTHTNYTMSFSREAKIAQDLKL